MDNAVIQTLHELFEDEKIERVNLIYLAIQGVIIYDINRGGLIYSDGTERYLLYGEAFHADFGRPHEDTNGECNHEELTHHLDDILSFLDDESTGVLPQVCKSWRDEVGTRSHQLWKMLLTRRGWLWTVELDENNALVDDGANSDAEATRLYKEAFVAHYLAVRDVQALSNACTYLQNGGGDGKAKQSDGIEYAVQSFKATKGSPDFDTNDIGRCTVKIWTLSNNPRALAGYGDCTLRLFEAVSSSTRMICRQVVCVRAAPPSISRKKNKCQLVSMDLDESVVASLINEIDDSLDIHVGINEVNGLDSRIIPWITVIPCEELITAGNEGILGDESIHSIDVRASILDYVMGGNEKITDLRDEVHQYLSVVDSDTSDILVTVTPKLHACGKGNFVFHACVSIPGYSLLRYTDADGDSLQGDEEARLRSLESVVPPTSVDHLFVISSQRGGSVIHSIQLLHGCEDLFASPTFRRHDELGSTLITNVVTKGHRLQLHQLVLNRGGIFQDNSYEVASVIDQNDRVYVTPTHVLYTRIGASRPLVFIQEIESRRIVLSMQIFSGASLQNIRLIHSQYVMIMFRSQATENEDDDDVFDGHWFGLNDMSLKIFVYYIPTGHLMHKSQLPNLHITLDGKDDDVFAFNASTLGFVIAGASAREVAWKAEDVDRLNDDSISSPNGKNARGKKKRLAAKVAKKDKKDGFARGMSMRG